MTRSDIGTSPPLVPSRRPSDFFQHCLQAGGNPLSESSRSRLLQPVLLRIDRGVGFRLFIEDPLRFVVTDVGELLHGEGSQKVAVVPGGL